ncbi:MAG: hypothetical protein Q9217_005049 [Psora testacea]
MELALGVLALCLPFGFVSAYDPSGSFFVLSASQDPILSDLLDPIMAPGTSPSNHVHEIYGGDKFSANWDFQTTQTSTCNNIGPKLDHSNYWFPALYFHGADGSYTKVPPHLSIYYHFPTADNGPRTMFPDGFRMISGNAMLRHDNTATEFSTKSIRWYCHGPEKVSVGAFPEGVTACPGVFGFSGEIWFPFCWDGVNDFDPKNPRKHVVFSGTSQQGGKCPDTHPKALPQLFMEFHHDIEAFANKPGAADPWVLAQGDPTGYGMHADFINGWENTNGSLADAIAVNPSDPTKTKCYTGNAGADKCFELLSGDVTSKCKIAPTTEEDLVGPMKALPGCNPIQPGPQDATIQTNCADYKPGTTVSGNTNTGDSKNDTSPISTSSTPASKSTPSTSGQGSSPPIQEKIAIKPPTTSDTQSPPEKPIVSSTSPSGGKPASIKTNSGEIWGYQGCYSDLDPDRSVRALGTWGIGKTNADCANHCVGAGFKIAGTEDGSQCFCGNSMKQSKKLDDGKCNTNCQGGESEACGGASALSVYAKQGTSLGLKRRSHNHRHVAHHKEFF